MPSLETTVLEFTNFYDYVANILTIMHIDICAAHFSMHPRCTFGVIPLIVKTSFCILVTILLGWQSDFLELLNINITVGVSVINPDIQLSMKEHINFSYSM